MTSLTVLVASLALVQAQAQPAAADAAARAAAAAEKAAQAAQVAAEAALRAAEAAQRISAVVPVKLEVPAAPAAAPAAPAAAKSAWTGTVGLGLMSLTGNSRSITFTTNAAAERKGVDWIVGGKLLAAYGQNHPATGDGSAETVAEMAALQLRLDRRFAERYSAYGLGAAATDHVKSIELRSTGELGATVVWVDAKGEGGWKTSLRTDLGFRISEERRYQYFPTTLQIPDVTLYAPRAAVAFSYTISKDVLFTEDVDVMSNVSGETRVLANSISKISVRLSQTLAFGVAFTVNHDSVPAPGKVPTDTQLAMTLDVLL
jgi:putative salt-induced outer membrane protein YdiY